MALTTQQKWQSIADCLAADPEPWNVSRQNTNAAIDAIDQWATDNTVSFNNALPAAAKNGLTATQKSLLLQAVLRRRAGQ